MSDMRRSLAVISIILLPLACENSATTPQKDLPAKSAPTVTVKSSAPTKVVKRPAARPDKKELPAPADVAKAPDDAAATPSGLKTKVLTEGSGTEKPTKDDKVKVHYTGWTTDGKMFDSSVTRNRPAQFGVTGVIKGWTEALQLMVTGEKRRLWIPADLAYGNKATRPGAPVGDLVFDVELIEIISPPKTPEDLDKPPKDAKKTKSGLVYRLLSKGKGTKKPGPKDKVRCHYSGWERKTGKMFDSSVARGRPATFGLDGVIKGWTEGLQFMTEGDKYRFWIPADLAYGKTPKRPGAPAGDLVFDVELLQVL